MLKHQLSLALASLTTLTTAKHIQDITQAEFSKQIQSNERTIVAFTSHSTDPKTTSFNSLFASTATNLTTPFLSINCNAEPQLCAAHDINALPTIRYFSRSNNDGEEEYSEPEMTRYRGPRTSHALHSFILKRELPILTHLENTQDLQSFKQIDTVVIIAYLRPDQSSLLATFKNVAERYATEVVFAYCTDSASADEQRVSVPSVVLYKNDDGDDKVLRGHFGEGDVQGLVRGAGESVIGVFRERDGEKFMVRDKLTVYIFVSTDSIDELMAIRHALTPLARKYLKYTIFATVDLGRYAEMARNFGIEVPGQGDEESKEIDPTIVVHAPMNDHIFKYRQGNEIDATSVESMLTTILQGKAADGQVFEGIGDARREGEGHDEL